MQMLIEGMFASGAVLISFGVVIGRITPKQLLVLAFLEVIFYSLNFMIGATSMGAVDMGGSIFVHMFGAYFGIGVSIVLGRLDKFKKHVCEEMGGSSRYDTDVFAMIGTLFLWILWPSFNGALAEGDGQFRVVINTVLALCASCMSAYTMSQALDDGAGAK